MIDWQAFHFLRPEWLLALIPLALLLLGLRHISRRQTGWQQVLAPHLYQHLLSGKVSASVRPPLGLVALGWTIATLALAGPTWERLPQPVYQLQAGKVIILDMSMSMRATDVTPDRLTRARFKAIDLLNRMNEGETGLVAYAGDAFTISPLTTDVQNLTVLLPSLRPEIMPVAGSDPFTGLETAISLLNNAGFQQGDLIWITDGIEFSQVNELAELVNTSPYDLSILAVGTAEGAPIRLLDGDLLKDASGAIVVPKLNMGALSGLATRTGAKLVALQTDDSDIEYLIDEQRFANEADIEDQAEQQPLGDEWKEMGPYLLLGLLPLAAYAFRRGLLACFALALILPLSAPPATASGWWNNIWQTADQKGMQAFEQQEFETAAQAFEDPMWRGSAHYRAGDYEQALNAFSQVEGPDGLYNQGNALARLGAIDDAIDAYEQALALQPGHEDAAANKELLENLKSEQEQRQQDQQQNDQQQSDSEQNEQQQQSQDSQQQAQQNQQDPSDQSQSGTDSQQQNDSQQQESQNEEQQGEETEQQQQSEQRNEDGEEQQQMQVSQEQQELTDEQREQMQRMQNLLRRVPDDPAFLLQRKMELEYQQRQRERLPTQLRKDW